MHQRCTNPNEESYKNYGAKGIKVYPRWREDFVVFYEWAMSNGYEDTLTIDRIDSKGNYEPSNCKWVTMKEQQNNKSTNVLIEINGVTKTATQWSEETGVAAFTIRERYRLHGGNPDILFKKEIVRAGKNGLVYINGVGNTVSGWAREAGVSRQTMHRRIKDGWQGEDLLKPVK